MRTTVNEFGQEVVTMSLSESGPLTDEEQLILREARDRAPVYDEDCPPMPEAMHRQIRDEIATGVV